MNVVKQPFPVTVTQTNEDYLVAKLDYFNQPTLLGNYSFNSSINELDDLYLSLVERLLDVDELENEVLKIDLTKGFPNILNLVSKETLLDKESTMQAKSTFLGYTNKSTNSYAIALIIDTISIIDIPMLIALTAFLGIHQHGDRLKSFTLVCLNIKTADKEKLTSLLGINPSVYPRLKFLKNKDIDDLTVEDFDFEL
jgi:hypothetical protein